jgi:exonuclease VII small subunit
MSETTAEDITFEAGYAELQALTTRLSAENVPIQELIDGFRRGSGLADALSTYLSARQGELTEIESGINLPAFNVVAPSTPSA